MKETGDLGKKLEEKEADFAEIKEEMGILQTDFEAHLSSAAKEWKASSEALTRKLCVIEERDQIKARLQSIEMEMTTLKQGPCRQRGSQCAAPYHSRHHASYRGR